MVRRVDHLQYLLVLAGCVVATLPLELLLGARVWRRPRRLLRVLAAPVIIFSAWDIAAIDHHQWGYARRYVTGIDLPGHLPLEEVAFFVVVPVCALLTYEVVDRMLDPARRSHLLSPVVGPGGHRRRSARRRSV
jgi:lycopene cyclase domain-containing protein